MTVQELRNILDDVDGSLEVCIANFQRFGSDIACDVKSVQEGYSWRYNSNETTMCLHITVGDQYGVPFTAEEYWDNIAEEEE